VRLALNQCDVECTGEFSDYVFKMIKTLGAVSNSLVTRILEV